MALSFSFSSADLALALPDPAPRLLPPPASASFPPRLTFSFSSVPPATVAAPRLAFSFAGGGDAARRERPAAGARAAALAVSYLSSPGSEARRLEIREGDLLEMAALQRLKVSARSLAAAVSFGFRYDRFERERLGDDASTAHRALQAPGVVAFMRFLTLGARLGTAAGREIPLAEAPDEADADDAARLAGDEISQLIQGSEGRLVCVSTWERYFQGFQLLADLFSEKGWRPLSSEDSRAYQMALTGLKRLRPHITHQMLQMPPLLLLTACEWMRTGDDFHKELALMAMLQFQCALCPIELSGDHFRNVDVFRSDEPNFLPVSAALGPPFFVLHIRDRKVKDSPLDYYVRVLRLEDDLAPFDAFGHFEAHLLRYNLLPLSRAEKADQSLVLNNAWQMRPDLPGRGVFAGRLRGVRSPLVEMGATQLRHGIRAALDALHIENSALYSGYSVRRGAAHELTAEGSLPAAVVSMTLGHSTSYAGSTPAYFSSLSQKMVPAAWLSIFRSAVTSGLELAAAPEAGGSPFHAALRRLFPPPAAGDSPAGPALTGMAGRLRSAAASLGDPPETGRPARRRDALVPVDLHCVCQLACTGELDGKPEGVNGFMLECANSACAALFHPTCIGIKLDACVGNAAFCDAWLCAACGGPPVKRYLRSSFADLAQKVRAADAREAAASASKRPKC